MYGILMIAFCKSFGRITIVLFALVLCQTRIIPFGASPNCPSANLIEMLSLSPVTTANIFYGRSLVDELDQFLESALKSSGLITSGKFEINSQLDEFNSDLLEIDEKILVLTDRYKSQFTAMEQVVTSLKSTGDYMENLLMKIIM